MVRACRALPARRPSVPRSSLSSQASTPRPRTLPTVAAASTVAVVLCTPPFGLAKASTPRPADVAPQHVDVAVHVGAVDRRLPPLDLGRVWRARRVGRLRLRVRRLWWRVRRARRVAGAPAVGGALVLRWRVVSRRVVAGRVAGAAVVRAARVPLVVVGAAEVRADRSRAAAGNWTARRWLATAA